MMQLKISRSDITRRLQERITAGEELAQREIRTEDDLTTANADRTRFDQFNQALTRKAFDEDSAPVTNYDKIVAPGPVVAGLSTPSVQERAKWFRDKAARRVNGLQAILEQLDLYDDPPEAAAMSDTSSEGPPAASAQAARLGLNAEMERIVRNLGEHPAGADSCHEAGFDPVHNRETDRAFQALIKRGLVDTGAYQTNGSGYTTMVDRVGLTNRGVTALDELRNGPPPPAQVVQVNIAGHNYGAAQAAGAGSAQTATSNVGASVSNDLDAFTELLRTALDAAGDHLGDDARAIIDSQLAGIDDERESDTPRWERVKGYLLSIVGVLGGLGLDGSWADVLQAGQVILEQLPV